MSAPFHARVPSSSQFTCAIMLLLVCPYQFTTLVAEDQPAPPAQVKARVAIKAARGQVPAQAVPADPQLLEETRLSVTQQLRRLIYAEVDFLDKVCQLTPEQRVRVAAEREPLRKQIADRYLPFLVGPRPAPNLQQPGPGTPREVIRLVLKEVLQPQLTEAQRNRYLAEVEAAQGARQRALATLMVAKLDEPLLLKATDRQPLVRKIVQIWDPQWEQSARHWTSSTALHANINIHHLAVVLSPEQQELFKSLRKCSAPRITINLGINPTEGLAALPWFDPEVDLPDQIAAGGNK